MPEESTTPDLVERVRVILEAADRADFDAILAFYASDAVWDMPGGLSLRQMRSQGSELFHVRGDKVTRLVIYWDRERAFADLGLEE